MTSLIYLVIYIYLVMYQGVCIFISQSIFLYTHIDDYIYNLYVCVCIYIYIITHKKEQPKYFLIKIFF